MRSARMILLLLIVIGLTYGCESKDTKVSSDNTKSSQKAAGYGTPGYGLTDTNKVKEAAAGYAEKAKEVAAGYGEKAKDVAAGYAEKAKDVAAGYGVQVPATGGYGAPAYGGGEEGSKGEALFNDPKFGNGTSGMSCNSCHPGGRGMAAAAKKSTFSLMGKSASSLEEAVNICIEMPLKGTPIPNNSQDMKDMVSYIKSSKN